MKVEVIFFALPEETLSFLQEWVDDQSLTVVAVSFSPFQLKLLTSVEKLSAADLPRRFLLQRQPQEFVLNAGTPLELQRKNPDALTLDIGQLRGNELRESVLASQNAAWKEVAQTLKRHTFEGLWVINPSTGAKSFSKKHRYTSGIKKRANELELCPPAGWNRFFVQEPLSQSLNPGPKS